MIKIKKRKAKCCNCKTPVDNSSEECCNCKKPAVIKTGVLKKKDLGKLKEI